MFKSLINLAGDVVKIVTAPVEVVADVARVVTKPLADVAETVVDEVKEVTDDLTK